MADPNWAEKGNVQSDRVIWKDSQGNIVSGPDYGGVSLGPFSVGQSTATQYSRVTFENGETWDIPDDGSPAQMVDFNPSMSAAYRAYNKSGGTFNWTDPRDGAEYLMDAQTGQPIRQLSSPIPGYVPSGTQPAQVVGSNTSAPYIVQQLPDGTLNPVPNPNYQAPGSEVMTAAQSAQLALSQAKFEWQKQMDLIANELARGQLSVQQATQKATELHNKMMEQLEQRGQDIGFATQTARAAGDLLASSLPYIAPKGTTTATMETLKGNFTPLPSMSFPFDPGSFIEQMTAKALEKISPYAASITGYKPSDFVAPTLGGTTPTATPSPLPRFIAPSASPAG